MKLNSAANLSPPFPGNKSMIIMGTVLTISRLIEIGIAPKIGDTLDKI